MAEEQTKKENSEDILELRRFKITLQTAEFFLVNVFFGFLLVAKFISGALYYDLFIASLTIIIAKAVKDVLPSLFSKGKE